MTHEKQFVFDAAAGNDWDDCASDYVFYSNLLGFYHRAAERLAGLVPPGANNLMDFGCGNGRFTREVLKIVGRDRAKELTVYLVDSSVEMLSLTRDLDQDVGTIVRVHDNEALRYLAADAAGRIDVIACNSSFHLCRDIKLFLSRAGEVLRPGSRLIANIPDQDFAFEDGWTSSFKKEANRLWYDPARDSGPRFSEKFLRAAAAESAFRLKHLSDEIYPLSWQEFVNFYSIPFMGARRMPNLTQGERLEWLNSIPPQFNRLDYRWVFFEMEKTA